jgi:protein gp37
MGDIGHPDIEWSSFLEVMRIVKRAAHHRFMMLTKRPEVLLERFQILAGTHPTTGTLTSTAHLANLPNLWVGVSVENQRRADERIPVLLQMPVAGRFVSVEPMLGQVSLVNAAIRQTNPGMCAPPIFEKYNFLTGERFLVQDDSSTWIGSKQTSALDWVICGAETGTRKRGCAVEWIDSLRRQCEVADVPFFGKKDARGKAILPREFPGALRLEEGVRHG